MKHRKLGVCAAGVAVVAVGAVGAAGAVGAVPSSVVVKEKAGIKVVPNRYIQDQLRWDRDVYTVKSGGTVVFLMNVPQEGPHTITVVAPRDLPTTGDQVNNCKICNTLAKAHGADPNSHGPPKFVFLENGVGQKAPPNLNLPGDSAFLPPKKGSKVTLNVTAPAGSTLTFMCLIHPWMQAKLKVQ